MCVCVCVCVCITHICIYIYIYIYIYINVYQAVIIFLESGTLWSIEHEMSGICASITSLLGEIIPRNTPPPNTAHSSDTHLGLHKILCHF